MVVLIWSSVNNDGSDWRIFLLWCFGFFGRGDQIEDSGRARKEERIASVVGWLAGCMYW